MTMYKSSCRNCKRPITFDEGFFSIPNDEGKASLDLCSYCHGKFRTVA